MTSSIFNSRIAMWMAWIVASIFYAYQYILRVMPSIMLTDIMHQFNFDVAGFGQFSGIYYIGYALMHLPMGIMLDRYGPKKIITGSILLALIGLIPLLFTMHPIYPIFGRFLIGIGSSAAILSVFKIIRIAFNEKKFPRMLSFSVTIGLIGAIYGGTPVSALIDSLGYRMVIWLFLAAGITLATIAYWLIPNIKSPSQKTVTSNIKEVLTNKKVISSCIFAGLMVGPLEGFADLWGTSFLKEVYKFDETLASSLPSMMFLGMCFGAALLSFLAEKIRSHTAVIIGAGITMTLTFSLMLTCKLTSGIISISFLLVVVCCAYQILAIYKASTYVRKEVSGLCVAVANMVIMTFGYAFHATTGSIINIMGGSQAPSALIYSVAAIPIALYIGTCGFVLLLSKEKNKVEPNFK